MLLIQITTTKRTSKTTLLVFIRQMEHKLLVMITMLGEIVLQNTCKMMVLMLPLKVVTVLLTQPLSTALLLLKIHLGIDPTITILKLIYTT